MWVASGAFVIYAWLWQIVGKEIIEASGQSIIIRKVVLGFSRSKEYLAEHIKDLRAVPMDMSSRGWLMRMALSGLLGGGTLAFDYEAKAFHFASGADEAEARQIVAAIKGRFPALARAASENIPFGVSFIGQRHDW